MDTWKNRRGTTHISQPNQLVRGNREILSNKESNRNYKRAQVQSAISVI